MPQYRYQARQSSGRIKGGLLVADNATAAATILRNQGSHVLKLVPMRERGGASMAQVLAALARLAAGPRHVTPHRRRHRRRHAHR